jgi:hypothetical protein
MSRISPFVRGLLIIAAIALLIVVLNLETSLTTAGLLVRVVFVLVIGLVAYMLWRDFGRREIGLWPARAQWVFYGAIGLLVADLAWYFVAGVSGLDALVFFVVLAACGFAMYWTWREQHRYS